jgi:hypothetical protein
MKDHDTTDGTEPDGPTIVHPGSGDGGGDVLSNVRTVETIADRVDLDRIDGELPGGWTVTPDLIPTEDEPLAETLLFRRSRAGPQVVLKPADPARPSEAIELHERRDPREASERKLTVDRLPEAVRVAVNRVRQLDG